jgi:hypothetical protein
MGAIKLGGFLTLAHYPKDNVDLILELHKSVYGLCDECSTLSTHIPYPCKVINEALKEYNGDI